MTPSELRNAIIPLDAAGPIHRQLEVDLREGVGHGKAWYSSQKEHWLGWLGDYSGPGAYGRANWANRSAEFVYNHIQCAPMLVWLAEALGLPKERLKAACLDVTNSGARHAAQCGAFRRTVHWAVIEAQLGKIAKEQARKSHAIAAKARPVAGWGKTPVRRR